MKFKTLMENLFSYRIKQFQSNDGGEFVSNHFKSLLESNGFTHRISCPYTAQYNGLVERNIAML
jgi:transposase InsO family protein